MSDIDIDGLFIDAPDPFGADSPYPEIIGGMLGRPAKGFITCPLAWLARVRSSVTTPDRLMVLQVLYSACLMQRSRTVPLSNRAFGILGISRWTKYRALAELAEAGVLTVEARNGRSILVTLHWFP
jgi:hypothetical protein